jgi:hypothetical protein
MGGAETREVSDEEAKRNGKRARTAPKNIDLGPRAVSGGRTGTEDDGKRYRARRT